MRPTTDCRCKHCQALLARRELDGLTVRRGDMQTTVTGTEFTVSVTCYRCKTLNVLTSVRKPTPAVAPQRPTAA